MDSSPGTSRGGGDVPFSTVHAAEDESEKNVQLEKEPQRQNVTEIRMDTRKKILVAMDSILQHYDMYNTAKDLVDNLLLTVRFLDNNIRNWREEPFAERIAPPMPLMERLEKDLQALRVNMVSMEESIVITTNEIIEINKMVLEKQARGILDEGEVVVNFPPELSDESLTAKLARTVRIMQPLHETTPPAVGGAQFNNRML